MSKMEKKESFWDILFNLMLSIGSEFLIIIGSVSFAVSIWTAQERFFAIISVLTGVIMRFIAKKLYGYTF